MLRKHLRLGRMETPKRIWCADKVRNCDHPGRCWKQIRGNDTQSKIWCALKITRLSMMVLTKLMILFWLQFIVLMVQRNNVYISAVNRKEMQQKRLRCSGSGMLKFVLIILVLQNKDICISTLQLLNKRNLEMNEMGLVQYINASKIQSHETKRYFSQKYILNLLLQQFFQEPNNNILLKKQLLCDNKTSYTKSKTGLLSLREFLEFHPQLKKKNQNNYHVYPVFLNSIDNYVKELASNPSLPIDEQMKYELVRLSSFRNFPQTSAAYPIRLADAGFYYTGESDQVSCFSCSASYKNWQPAELPIDVHRRISPNCHFINGNERSNVPICHESRNASPTRTSTTAPSRGRMVADSSVSNISQNVSSQRNENDTHSLQTRGESCHMRNGIALNDSSTASASISMSRTTLDVNRSLEFNACVNDVSELGVSYDSPKYPKCAVLAVRISSYTGWPTYKSQSPQSLSSAGLFYAGFGDCVRCFFCGGGLRNWEEGDDPWVEHARWFPRCSFVRQCKGDNFVQEVMNAVQQLTMAGAECSHGDRDVTVADPLLSPAAVSVLEMGYSNDQVMDAITKLNTRGNQPLKAESIMEYILDSEDRSRENTEGKNNDNSNGALRFSNGTEKLNRKKKHTTSGNDASMSEDMHLSIVQENIQLKEQSICKICMDENISIVFLPCGHMATCVQCAPALRRCPICRTNIKGTIRAFMS